MDAARNDAQAGAGANAGSALNRSIMQLLEHVDYRLITGGEDLEAIFNTVIKEGVVLAKDNPEHYGSQAVDLSPAQGAIVEFTTAEDGMYPIVTHAFNLVGRGALGLIQAGDGDPKN